MLDETDKENRELADRIRAAIKESGRTKSEVAELLGVSPQAITGWETKGRISKKSLAGLALMTGRPVEQFLGSEPATPPAEVDWADITGYAQAVGLGSGPEAQEYAETHRLKFRSDSLARKRLNPRHLAVMYGHGDSMLPRLRPGDAILFDTSDTRPRDGDLFVILVHGVAGNEYQVKRCELLDDLVYFKADNPNGDHNWKKPKRMDNKRSPVQIVGRVRWLGSWEE